MIFSTNLQRCRPKRTVARSTTGRSVANSPATMISWKSSRMKTTTDSLPVVRLFQKVWRASSSLRSWRPVSRSLPQRLATSCPQTESWGTAGRACRLPLLRNCFSRLQALLLRRSSAGSTALRTSGSRTRDQSPTPRIRT